MKKLGLALTSCLLITSLSLMPVDKASAATLYSDITVKHRAYDEIYYLAKSDITTSDKANTYSPDAPMTRGHAAAMIGKALQLNGEKTTTRFSDVPADHFASGYIDEAVKRNIILGYGNGTFQPEQTLKRGEMALLISRAFGYTSGNVTHAAREFLDKGISQGYGNGDFGTEDLMKRGDFAIFLARAINADFRVKDLDPASVPMYVNIGEDTSLYMRTGPSTEYNPIKLLYAGYPVEVLYRVGEWLYVNVNGDYGFVHGSFIATEEPYVSSIQEPVDLATDIINKAVNELTIIIDPGHGAHDPGGTGFGLKEKDMVLDMSLRMKKYFEQTPIPVKLTREKDVFLSLSERVNFAVQNKGDVFVSVHTNAFNGVANGIETFYYGAAYTNPNVDQSKALTTYIHKRMLEAWNLTDRKVQSKSLHVIRENSMPATLIEAGFLDHKTDHAYIASPSQREKMARGVFLGVLDYYYHYEGRIDFASLYQKFDAKPSSKHY